MHTTADALVTGNGNLWASPQGHHCLRDNTGTRDVTDPDPPDDG